MMRTGADALTPNQTWSNTERVRNAPGIVPGILYCPAVGVGPSRRGTWGISLLTFRMQSSQWKGIYAAVIKQEWGLERGKGRPGQSREHRCA